MDFEVSKDQRREAIALIVHCFRVGREESVGWIAAGGRLTSSLQRLRQASIPELWLMS